MKKKAHSDSIWINFSKLDETSVKDNVRVTQTSLVQVYSILNIVYNKIIIDNDLILYKRTIYLPTDSYNNISSVHLFVDLAMANLVHKSISILYN